MGGLRIRLPKIRIEVPSAIKDAERLVRQLGVFTSVEEQVEEQAAQELAKGSLLSWQLRSAGRIFVRAAQIKDAKQ